MIKSSLLIIVNIVNHPCLYYQHQSLMSLTIFLFIIITSLKLSNIFCVIISTNLHNINHPFPHYQQEFDETNHPSRQRQSDTIIIPTLVMPSDHMVDLSVSRHKEESQTNQTPPPLPSHAMRLRAPPPLL